MQNKNLISAKMLGLRWSVHPTTAVRIMVRFGEGGLKFGDRRQCSRRFSMKSVLRVESWMEGGEADEL
jgi:hypothetical protein